jgi:hypothetical protein
MAKTRHLVKKRNGINHNISTNKTRKTGGVIFNNIDITQNGDVKIKIFSSPSTIGSYMWNSDTLRKMFYSEESIVRLYNKDLRSFFIKGTGIVRPDNEDTSRNADAITFYAVSQGKLTYRALTTSKKVKRYSGGVQAYDVIQSATPVVTGSFAAAAAATAAAKGLAVATGVVATGALGITPVGWAALAGAATGATFRASKYLKSDLRNDMPYKACYTIQPTYSFIDRLLLNYFVENQILCMSCCVLDVQGNVVSIKRTIKNDQNNKNFQLSGRKTPNLNKYGVIFFTFKSFNDNARLYEDADSVYETGVNILSGVSKNQWKIEPQAVFRLTDRLDFTQWQNAMNSLNADLLSYQGKTQEGVLNRNVAGIKRTIEELKLIKQEEEMKGLSNENYLDTVDSRRIVNIKKKIINFDNGDKRYMDTTDLNVKNLISTVKSDDKNKTSFAKIFENFNDVSTINVSNSFDHQEFWYNLCPVVLNAKADDVLDFLSKELRPQCKIFDKYYLESDGTTYTKSGKPLQKYRQNFENNRNIGTTDLRSSTVVSNEANGWSTVDINGTTFYKNVHTDEMTKIEPTQTHEGWLYSPAKNQYLNWKVPGSNWKSNNEYNIALMNTEMRKLEAKIAAATQAMNTKRTEFLSDETALQNLKTNSEILNRNNRL